MLALRLRTQTLIPALPNSGNAGNTGVAVIRVRSCGTMQRMRVLAIGNQKGGVAKTTTAAVLGMLLSRAGHRVHLVDMDPQASLTSTFGRRDEDGWLND